MKSLRMIGTMILAIGLAISLKAMVSIECDGWTSKAGVCVPGSILEAEFAAYQPAQPPPLEVLASQVRARDRSIEELSGAWHTCEAALAPKTADDRKKASQAADEEMFKRLEAFAPEGQTWSREQGRYVSKPIDPKKGSSGPR